jgi:hypothetical protein
MRHVLIYTDDMNLLGDNINTMKKITEAVIDATEDADLEVYVVTKMQGKMTIDPLKMYHSSNICE